MKMITLTSFEFNYQSSLSFAFFIDNFKRLSLISKISIQFFFYHNIFHFESLLKQ